MVMYSPAKDDEITTIWRYLQQQLDAIRAATLGLTEAQARSTPTKSALSVAGIVKHTAHGMRGANRTILEGPMVDLSPEGFAAYMGSFALTDDETLEGVLEEFDEAAAALLVTIVDTDPDGDGMAPAAPWDGIFEPQPITWRFYLLHQIEEMARHAGHADIIREQIDGEAVPRLSFTLAGKQANDFFQPYVPAPGT
jgi:hypothetical protein